MQKVSLSKAAKLLGQRSYQSRLGRLGIDRIREIARKNGKLGGRPRKARGVEKE
jgi:hypothetical protein